MRFEYNPLFGFSKERRMLCDHEQGATEKDRKKMENLHMAEFREKSKYAYDKVQDRVNEYRGEVTTLRNQLRAVRETDQWKSKQSKRLQSAERETGRIQKEIGVVYKTYSDDVLKEMSKGNKDLAKIAQTQEKLFYRVDTLEHFYTFIENEISQVEQSLISKNIDVRPTLQQRMLGRRLKTFEDQRKATREDDQLRTIEVDWYSKPFDKMERRAYHLLRLPRTASVSFRATINGVGIPQEGHDYEVINLSGGAQYIKFTAEFMQSLPDGMDPQPFVMKITVKDPDGGPDKTYDAIPHKTKDGLNNLTFSFASEARTEVKPKEPKAPAEEKKGPPPKSEDKPKDEPMVRLRQAERKEAAPPNFKKDSESMSNDQIRSYLNETYVPSLNKDIAGEKDLKNVEAMLVKTGFKHAGDNRFVLEKDDRRVVLKFAEGVFSVESVDYTDAYLEAGFVRDTKHMLDRLNTVGDKPEILRAIGAHMELLIKRAPHLLTQILVGSGCSVTESGDGLTATLPLQNGKQLLVQIQGEKVVLCQVTKETKEKSVDPLAKAREAFDLLRQGNESITGQVIKGVLEGLAVAFPNPQELLNALIQLGVTAKLEGQKIVASLNLGNNVLLFSIENGKVTQADLRVPIQEDPKGPTSYALVPLVALIGLPLAKLTYNKVKNLSGVRQTAAPPPSPPPPQAEYPRGQHMVLRQEMFEVADNLKPYLKPGANADDIAQAFADYMDIDNNLLLEPAEKLKALKPIEAEIKAQLKNPEQFKELTQYYQDYVTRAPGDPEVKAPVVKDAPPESAKKTVTEPDKKTIVEKPAEKVPASSEKWVQMEGKIKAQLKNPGDPKALEEVKGLLNRLNVRIDPRKIPDGWQEVRQKEMSRLKELLKDGASADDLVAEYKRVFRTGNTKPAPVAKIVEKPKAAPPVAEKVPTPKNPLALTDDVRARIRGSKNPYEILGLDKNKLPSIEDLGKLQNKLLKDIVKDPKNLSQMNKFIGEMYQLEVDNGKDVAKLKKISRWKELKQQIKALLIDAKDIDIAEKIVKARHMVINKNPGLVFDALDVDQLLKVPNAAPKVPAEAAPKASTEPAKAAKKADAATEATKLAKAEAMKKFMELTKGLDQEKALALLTEHGADLGMDAKTIANFQKSKKAGGALFEALKGGDTAGMERLLKAGQGASKMRIALNTLGVGLDVFALAMTYNDWQANGGRIEAAEATGNKALANLYRDAYVMYGVEGSVTLVCGTVALVSSTAGLCLLPVTMVVMGAGHVYREVEGMRENMLKSYKDYLGLPPAEMLHKMHELLNTYSYTGKAFLWMGKGATWEDARQTEFSHAANALTQLTRSYLMKTAELSPSPGENQEQFRQRFELYVRDAMDYLGRQTGSRYTQATSWELPEMFRRSMAHAQLCATSRELSGAGMTREVKWKGDDGKEYTFDLSKYHEAPPDGMTREDVQKWHAEKEKAVRAYMAERAAEKFESVKNIVGLMNEKNKSAEADPGMARQKFMQQMLLQDIAHDLHKFDQVLQFSDFSGLDIPFISEGDTNARTLVRYATFLMLRKELLAQSSALLDKPNMEKKDYDQAVQNLRNLLNPSERGALIRQQFAEGKKLNETNDFARAKAFANRLLQPEYILQNLALPQTNITQTGTKEKPAEMHAVFESPDRTIITGPDGIAHLKGMNGYQLVPIKNGMVYSNEGVRAGGDDFAFHGEGYFAVWKPENAPLYGNAFTPPDLVIRVVKPETAAERGKTVDNPIDINHRNPPKSITRPYGSPLYLRMPRTDYQWGRFGPNGQIEEVLVTNSSGTLSIQAPGNYGFWPKGRPEQHFQIRIN